MSYHVSSAKLLYVAATVATAGVATTAVIDSVFHWDVIVGDAVQGIFSVIILVLLRQLHVMVNSQQSDLNKISAAAHLAAGVAQGKLQGLAEAAATQQLKDSEAAHAPSTPVVNDEGTVTLSAPVQIVVKEAKKP